ncbi:RNA-binding protein 34 isoform 2-T2 [Alca torda]
MVARRRVADPRRVQGPAAARGRGGEGYAVGQVADSLGPGGAAAAPLASLFSAAAAPPVLAAVRGENKKRKRTEEAEKVSEDQSSPVVQEPPVKAKKSRKKELSKPEKNLGYKESTLERADEEEEQKRSQNRVKQKKGASQAVTKSVVNSNTGTTVKQQKTKKVDDESVDRRTVFVGNLPVSCTAQALKSLFKEYGQIQSIRFRSLVPAEDTLSKKLAAIKNGTEFASGFHIRVDIASKTSLHDNKRSIFLGNLSYDISDDAVREHFSVCGGVVAVRIVRDGKTGLGKGFGYVLFENMDAVHLALKLNDSVLVGRKIRVKRCGEKWKAPQKHPDQSRAPKDRVDTKLKNSKRSKDSFVGEKANPLKKSTKQKRLKTIPRNKAGKNKKSFDKKTV